MSAMKRNLLLLLFAMAVVLSCGKDGKTEDNDGQYPESQEVMGIDVPESVALLVGYGETLIPVNLSPDSLPVDEFVSVSGGNDKVFTWSLSKEGILVTPLATGSGTLTVKALRGPADKKDITVQVIDGIQNFTLSFSSAWAQPYTGNGGFGLTVGKKYHLQAIITDKNGHSITTPVNWKVDGEGVTLVRRGIDGELTVEKGGKTVTVTATLPADQSKASSLSLQTYDAPTRIVLGETASVLELKSGDANAKTVNVRVEPSGAIQAITVSTSSSDIVCSTYTISGNYSRRLLIKAAASRKDPYTLTVASEVEASVNASLSIAVTDYSASDVKAGDYVYYNSSTGKFRSSDCGRRLESVSYLDQLIPPSAQSGETYVGIIMKVYGSDSDLPTKDFHSLTAAKLKGLSNSPGTHVYVWAKNEVQTAWNSSSSYQTQYWQSSWGTDSYGFVFTEKLPSTIDIKKALGQFTIIGNYSSGTTGWFIPCYNDPFTGAWYYKIKDSFTTALTDNPFAIKNNVKYKYYWTPGEDKNGNARQYSIDLSIYISTETNRWGQKNLDYLSSLNAPYLLRPAFII